MINHEALAAAERAAFEKASNTIKAVNDALKDVTDEVTRASLMNARSGAEAEITALINKAKAAEAAKKFVVKEGLIPLSVLQSAFGYVAAMMHTNMLLGTERTINDQWYVRLEDYTQDKPDVYILLNQRTPSQPTIFRIGHFLKADGRRDFSDHVVADALFYLAFLLPEIVASVRLTGDLSRNWHGRFLTAHEYIEAVVNTGENLTLTLTYHQHPGRTNPIINIVSIPIEWLLKIETPRPKPNEMTWKLAEAKFAELFVTNPANTLLSDKERTDVWYQVTLDWFLQIHFEENLEDNLSDTLAPYEARAYLYPLVDGKINMAGDVYLMGHQPYDPSLASFLASRFDKYVSSPIAKDDLPELLNAS